MFRPAINRFALTILTTVYLLLLCNRTFWEKAWDYSHQDILYMISLAVLLVFILNALIGSFAYKYALKTVIILFIAVAGTSAYFVDSFGIIIDRGMINNALATDTAEASELITTGFLTHIALMVILPIALLIWVKIDFPNFKKTYFQNVAFVSIALVAAIGVFLVNSSNYMSMARNHRDLVKSLHPSQPIVALVKVTTKTLNQQNEPLVKIGNDAAIDMDDDTPIEKQLKKPKLTVLVLGETARAKSFSLNGYERETNPELKKLNVFNFENTTSCGTATAVSVPCMFSHFNFDNYSDTESKHTENVIDIISKAGIRTLWINNNSGSKGQADRILYMDARKTTDSQYCKDGSCFDEVLVEKLGQYIEKNEVKDTLVVLHQLGSHGPSYYKRVPQSHKQFFPECGTSELNKCSQQEIINSYDNTILYTDFVLSKIINYLKSKSDTYDTAMLYMSDHGESTGEYGLYLHGMPYALAPDEQTHVPFITWISDSVIKQEEIDRKCMKELSKQHFSHDNLFHTLLEITEVDTKEYGPKMDVFNACSDDHELLN